MNSDDIKTIVHLVDDRIGGLLTTLRVRTFLICLTIVATAYIVDLEVDVSVNVSAGTGISSPVLE